ncbi:hypothetical protein D3C75_783600 [compost metagenome]
MNSLKIMKDGEMLMPYVVDNQLLINSNNNKPIIENDSVSRKQTNFYDLQKSDPLDVVNE